MTSECQHLLQKQSLPPQLVDPNSVHQALKKQYAHVLAKAGSWCEEVNVQQVELREEDPAEELDACCAPPSQNAAVAAAMAAAEGQSGPRLQHDLCQLMGNDPERCEEVPVRPWQD